MKSERRHELQTNELADTLAVYVELVKPYTKAIVGGLLAIVVLGLAYSFMSQQQNSKLGQGWNELFNVISFNDPLRRDEVAMGAELDRVALRNQGTLPGLWALSTEANLDLEAGTGKLFNDREAAKENFERARKNYERIEKEAGRSPLLQQEARFGLAQVLECLGEVSKAKDKFDQVARSAPESALGKSAAARAKLLSEDDYKNFVDWFQHQKPKAANPHAGIPGMGSGQIPGMGAGKIPPLNFDDLPQAPNISFPKTPGGDTTPNSDDKKPDADKPDAAKPDVDKPEKKGDETKPDAPKTEAPKTDADAKAVPEKKAPEAAPAEKPTDKPAEKSVEKPADKPADAPAKPDEKKEASATEKPATPAVEKKADAAPAKP